MARRILSGALIAGLLVGLLAAALNIATLVPLILQAETYEAAASQGHGHGDEAAGEAPARSPGAEGLAGRLWRDGGTVAMTLVAYAGFGLILGSGMALTARRGHPVSPRAGALWGAAAFAAVHLAPAAGLPPELPGMEAAALPLRQAWWAFCVASTAFGLASLAFGRGAAVLALGVALVALPHLVGAPVAPDGQSLVPPALAAEFAARSLGVAAVAWLALGTLIGWLGSAPALERADARA